MIDMIKNNEKGNIAILMCFMITALLGMAAFAVDIGIVYAEKIKLSNSIDSAVLAAALDIPQGEVKTIQTAQLYLQKNKVDMEQIHINMEGSTIAINGIKDVENYFAKTLGIDYTTVNASTKAIIGPAKSIKGGVRPLAVEDRIFNYGELVTLKEGGGDGESGNYGAVSLGGYGSNVFRQNVIYGYDEVFNVGDQIETEPGNMATVVNELRTYIREDTETYLDFSRDSIRIWTLPIIEAINLTGRDTVTVVGFAQFFLEDIQSRAGQAEIQGRFIKYVSNGEIDLTIDDTGAYGVKLIQ